MEQYLEIRFQHLTAEQKEILIARLSDIGFNGFDESDRQLVAFIALQDFDEQAFIEIIPAGISYSRQVIDEKNWNEEWEKSFSPVIIDDYCVIRASFHQPSLLAVHEIIITPKMSFGTGHHATTFLVIRMMRGIELENKTVLDFGTGTGVLAILAEKEGAREILAIDNDEWSINNAHENISDNHCGRITVRLTEKLEGKADFDVILANINKRVILEQLQAMEQRLNENGVILVSGILKGDVPEITAKAISLGLVITAETFKDSWMALLFKHKRNS